MKTATAKQRNNKTAKIIPFPNRKPTASNEDCDSVDFNALITGGEDGFYCWTARNSCGVIVAGDVVAVDRYRKPRIGEYVCRNGKVDILADIKKTGFVVVAFL